MAARNSQSMVEVAYQPPGNQAVPRVSQVMIEVLVSTLASYPALLNMTAIANLELPKNFQEDDKYK